jgi:DNA-3-methyladenine glycosylase I
MRLEAQCERTEKETCPLPDNDPLFQQYHDNEWGIPQLSDTVFFEKVCLEGFQSGLSWRTILHRREAFRELFDGFDMDSVARYSTAKLKALSINPRIIRNQRKIASAVNNAQRAIDLREEYGSLARFFWQFEPDTSKRAMVVDRSWLTANAQTVESAALAKALKQRGWSFVGPINMYALMQALGIVNDHVEGCPRHAHIDALRASFDRPT